MLKGRVGEAGHKIVCTARPQNHEDDIQEKNPRKTKTTGEQIRGDSLVLLSTLLYL